jgi:twitching motility protein PilT
MPSMSNELREMLELCVRQGASDLHVSAGEPPYLRIDGELRPAADEPSSADAVRDLLRPSLTDAQQAALDRDGTLDIAFALGDERFRGHVYRERSGLAIAARRLGSRFLSLDELGLPEALGRLTELRDGLVLFTGPTGSGKTTTLATLLHRINRSRRCHILTIEDPIEFVHRNERSLVHQRQVHTDVASFADAVRASLREDPDVVLVGEMRDLETMRTAITVAETGHLVFSTLHCGNAVGSLDRLIGAFPEGERESLCQQLSMTLRAVVTQRLLPRADGPGRVPAVEILWVTKGVANLIRNHKSEQIPSAMEGGGAHGMQLLEQSLAQLVAAGTVDEAEARQVAENPQDFEQRLQLLRTGRPGGRRR